MARIAAFITVVGEDVPASEPLPRRLHLLQHRACANAKTGAAVMRVALRPGCSFTAFAGEVNDDIDGGREAFEAHLQECGVEPVWIAGYLRLWDASARPVAIVHIAEREPA